MRTVAAIAVLCTVFALAVPVFAQGMVLNLADSVLHTHNVFCYDSTGHFICPLRQLEEHTHTDLCYETAAQGHTHTDACYALERGALICEVAEQAGHVHTDACYKSGAAHEHTTDCYTRTKGELLCTVAEQAGHSHGKNCYATGEALTCGLEENEEHTHGASCYEKILVCDIPEVAGHAHSDACFAWTEVLTCDAATEKVLICTETEQMAHVHGDGCYEVTRVLTCNEAEQDVESTTPAQTEKILICTLMEIKKHIHDASCFTSDRRGVRKLICKQPHVKEHQHTQACLGFADEDLICKEESKEHSHDYRCYCSWSFLCQGEKVDEGPKSDPEADVETPEIWEETFAHVKLTGAWPQDLLAIAQTQLGYKESSRNFQIKNGYEKGYTRYGEWYGGVEYGDWCAMFIAFCMHYAGIKGVPFSCGCDKWIDMLRDAGMYAEADAYLPRPGDFVFFDSDRTETTPDTVPVAADHVAIVVEVIPATEEEPAAIVTIEGNYFDAVRNETRYMNDPRIIGYGLLPDGPTAHYSCGLQAHVHAAVCYDETGKLTCGEKEHQHEDHCRSRKLSYADENITVAVTLSEAVYLPTDLSLCAVLLTEQEVLANSAMTAAVGKALPEAQYAPESMCLCRMQLSVGGRAYELPAGVQADVQVAFNQPVCTAVVEMESADKYTFVLLEETPEVFADTAYSAVALSHVDYQCTDAGIVGVGFTTDQISTFVMVIDNGQQLYFQNALLDLISKVK